MLHLDELEECLAELPAFNFWESHDRHIDLMLVEAIPHDVVESVNGALA